jgi:hypothetical protein
MMEERMATYQITYWQEIPSQVDAREAGGKAAKQMLGQRFQELIDIIATRRKLDSSDDYIAQWSKGEKIELAGSPDEVVRAVAAELEARYDEIRAKALAQPAIART